MALWRRCPRRDAILSEQPRYPRKRPLIVLGSYDVYRVVAIVVNGDFRIKPRYPRKRPTIVLGSYDVYRVVAIVVNGDFHIKHPPNRLPKYTSAPFQNGSLASVSSPRCYFKRALVSPQEALDSFGIQPRYPRKRPLIVLGSYDVYRVVAIVVNGDFRIKHPRNNLPKYTSAPFQNGSLASVSSPRCYFKRALVSPQEALDSFGIQPRYPPKRPSVVLGSYDVYRVVAIVVNGDFHIKQPRYPRKRPLIVLGSYDVYRVVAIVVNSDFRIKNNLPKYTSAPFQNGSLASLSSPRCYFERVLVSLQEAPATTRPAELRTRLLDKLSICDPVLRAIRSQVSKYTLLLKLVPSRKAVRQSAMYVFNLLALHQECPHSFPVVLSLPYKSSPFYPLFVR
ncbi:hypothetical protein DFH06DRAFT_1351344 [Mycena polygramma]|nr:hypothetical protein DFH06DRAFT_1351344 [Mycena polygramma]